jgi:thymidine kinase
MIFNNSSINTNSGYLEIIVGPMFSGKTKYLTQIYDKYNYIGKKITTINYEGDTRYSNTCLSTHDKIMIPCIFINNLYDIYDYKIFNEIILSDVILINEAQFFGDLFNIVLDLVEKYNKIVYVCGLDGDYKREKFGTILDLIPFCDKIVKLKSLCSICKNGNHGIFSHRKKTNITQLNNSILNEKSEQLVIGSSNYETLCRKCYIINITQ